MRLFCLDEFKTEFDKLVKLNPYRSLEKDIIKYFFVDKVDDVKSGTRLNNDSESPYIKKRISGASGFRAYFLILVKDEKVFLMFVHPITGPKGSSNITDESKALLYKSVLNSIKENRLHELKLNDEKNKIIFTATEAKTS